LGFGRVLLVSVIAKDKLIASAQVKTQRKIFIAHVFSREELGLLQHKVMEVSDRVNRRLIPRPIGVEKYLRQSYSITYPKQAALT